MSAAHGTEGGQPLELILARNLVSILAIPALLVDAGERIVFFNAAAADTAVEPFEEIGTMSREEWNQRYGPFDEHGEPMSIDELPLVEAIRDGRPGHARFRIGGTTGIRQVEAGALPLLGPAGYAGAVVFFWAADAEGGS